MYMRRSNWSRKPGKLVSTSHFKKKALVVSLVILPFVVVLAMPTPEPLTTYGIQIKMPEAPVIDVADDAASTTETNVAVVSVSSKADTETLPPHHSADPAFKDIASQAATNNTFHGATDGSFETAYAGGQSFSGGGFGRTSSGSASTGSTGGVSGGGGGGGIPAPATPTARPFVPSSPSQIIPFVPKVKPPEPQPVIIVEPKVKPSIFPPPVVIIEPPLGGDSDDRMGPTVVVPPPDEVIIAGLFQPGNSPGIENYTNLTLKDTAITEIEIGGLTPGQDPNGYDQVNVSGLLTLGGILDIILYNGFFPNAGDSFEIFTFGSITGNFSQINGLTLRDNCSFSFREDEEFTTIDFDQSSIILYARGSACGNHSQEVGTSPEGNDHGDVTIAGTFRPGQIPEPGTLAIFGLGLVGMAVIRRRRRA